MKLKLSAWRRAREITQDQMAKRLDISKPTYVRWEKEPQKITMYNAQKIADVLDTEIQDIIFLP
jgi:DNA-binding XRE family transcriptional regulator